MEKENKNFVFYRISYLAESFDFNLINYIDIAVLSSKKK